ncbi:TIGR02556 family CRISPR-associated protein [Acetomicrobium sp.]|uniref:TIGR02556 family CRISPR-associated protein n=1 Tax=Acetomicrobium sp. TaxID=1872099 RepID=UPI001BCB39C4|nr:TIGR02556 family CRISPR-associated protein [Acetomicrobium sp.]
MIEGIRAIGEVVLQRNDCIVDALAQEIDVQNQKKYAVFIDVCLDPIKLSFDIKEIDINICNDILWVGNSSRNKPQDRLTTDTVAYLVSQTIPNLCQTLPPGGLRSELEALKQTIYLDLGGKYDKRYRLVWDLLKFDVITHAVNNSRKPTEIIENKGIRQKAETLYNKQASQFLNGSFLQEYACQYGAKEVPRLIGTIIEGLVIKQLKLKKQEIGLYTLKLNGKLLCKHPDYIDYLEKSLVSEAFEGASEGVCHTCGSKKRVTGDTTRFRLMKFYITDKPGFASELSPNNFVRNFGICCNCYRQLLAGERFAENQLRTTIASSSVYVIPEFYLPAIELSCATLNKWAEYLKKRVSATQTLKQWQDFQDALKDYQEFENVKASFVLNLLFATKSRGAVKVDMLIQDVPPSRLDRLDDVRNRILGKATYFFGDSNRNDWDLGLGKMFYLFPVRKQKNQVKDHIFLEFLDALLTNRSFSIERLISEFLETACVHYYERKSYVQSSLEQKRQTREPLTIFLIQSQLLLLYLKELGQLEGLNKGGGKIMESLINILDEKLQAYLQNLNLNYGQQALFLIGYLIGRIGSTKEQISSGKPILNKIHFQGMDKTKLVRLANEVYEKLRQYKIAKYNEDIYAAMKTLLDKELLSLNSPQDNTYWILSGYAYATLQAIQHASKQKETGKEILPQT